MNIGEEIIIGKLGQQPMQIADANVDPQHAILRKLDEEWYQIEDNGSTKGVFVFGMRIKRKKVKADTPILLGPFKITVSQLLYDASTVDLEEVWNVYEAEKRVWDRKTMLVNYLRILPSILTMLVTMFLGQDMENNTRIGITVGLTVGVLVISMVASEKIMAKKNVRLQEMNHEMQTKYACPHCHRALPLTPYKLLKNTYCQNPACNRPLP